MNRTNEIERREEMGYRRGFDQAFATIIYLMEDGQTFEEIKKLKLIIFKWRYTFMKAHGDPRLKVPIDQFKAENNRKILKKRH